jgi:hypothetical protein
VRQEFLEVVEDIGLEMKSLKKDINISSEQEKCHLLKIVVINYKLQHLYI